ncbi:molecular chaperone GrpE [Allopseudospirillum japonicum]|uniref:Protein GrpE n=1 Tax=Allopseudospirillum japonicum TaxID=64971 RepID=A0A1H6R6F3_9GAMM|nr:nucleotide exchange factor GrpE [Allopseudospirillum japonicum]SEI47205.1 molecular chaperone GrpE [Allopseudospirillum japonicum]
MSTQDTQSQQQETQNPELEPQTETLEASTSDTSDVSTHIQTLEDELAHTKDQLLRAAAEMQNVRRRAEQDVEKAHKFGLDKFARELLTVVDSLEKALENAPQEASEAEQSWREGVEMTLKLLLDTLKKFGVEQIDPMGAPFDPQVHEAMSLVPNPNVEPNTVMAVMQKGYTLHERLLRPAMVMVSSG